MENEAELKTFEDLIKENLDCEDCVNTGIERAAEMRKQAAERSKNVCSLGSLAEALLATLTEDEITPEFKAQADQSISRSKKTIPALVDKEPILSAVVFLVNHELDALSTGSDQVRKFVPKIASHLRKAAALLETL